jgi:hypothetical protein
MFRQLYRAVLPMALLLAAALTPSAAFADSPDGAAITGHTVASISRTSPAAAGYSDFSSYVWSEDNDASGKCLDASNYGRGSTIIVWPCQFGANERWTVTVVDWAYGGYYAVVTFQNDYPGYCLDAWPGRGKQLVQLPCDGTSTQRFITDWYSNMVGGFYRVMPTVLESVSWPGQCVDIRNWGADYTVQLWDCNGAYNQKWHW